MLSASGEYPGGIRNLGMALKAALEARMVGAPAAAAKPPLPPKKAPAPPAEATAVSSEVPAADLLPASQGEGPAAAEAMQVDAAGKEPPEAREEGAQEEGAKAEPMDSAPPVEPPETCKEAAAATGPPAPPGVSEVGGRGSAIMSTRVGGGGEVGKR
jgi:hypothetical protein